MLASAPDADSDCDWPGLMSTTRKLASSFCKLDLLLTSIALQRFTIPCLDKQQHRHNRSISRQTDRDQTCRWFTLATTRYAHPLGPPRGGCRPSVTTLWPAAATCGSQEWTSRLAVHTSTESDTIPVSDNKTDTISEPDATAALHRCPPGQHDTVTYHQPGCRLQAHQCKNPAGRKKQSPDGGNQKLWKRTAESALTLGKWKVIGRGALLAAMPLRTLPCP
jgi:hypothetical protein